MKNLRIYSIAFLIGALTSLAVAQQRGTPAQIRVNIDAAGNLGVSTAAQTNPITQVQFLNARLAVDSSGNIGVYNSSGSGFAPSDATYITQTANSSLSAEQALGTLSSGLLAVTTTTGVVASIAHAAAGDLLVATGTGTVPSWTAETTYASSILKVNGASPVTGTAGSIYIGNASPDTTGINTAGVIHLQAANSAAPQTILTGYAGQPTILFRRAGNTFASPSALTTDDIIGSIGARAWGTAFLTTSDAAIQMKAAEAIDGTHHGSYITFETTPTASVTRAIVGGFGANGAFFIGTGLTANNIRMILNGNNVLQIAGGAGGSGIRLEASGWWRNSAGTSATSSAGASSVETAIKNTTAIPDATPTTVATITIPNTAQAAAIEVTFHGTMGAGGAIGENEASATITYIISVTRTLNLNAVAAISSGFGSAASNVAGGGTITLAGTLGAVSGTTTATNTVAVQATITKSGGSSSNHKCWVTLKIINSNASGITMAS